MRRFFRVLSRNEKQIFFGLVVLSVGSFVALSLNYYFARTITQAQEGGDYTEGITGQPRFVNPLYLSTQDIDRDIVEIIFSGLMKYDENGKIVPDLAQSYEVKDEGKTFEFIIKKAFWHDGQDLTTDDIAFTASLIQNPEYQSPLRIKLTGVLVEQASSAKIIFKLPKQYPGFLETLTFKILPEHIFKDASPNSLPWTLVSKDYLVGSGPFKFKELKQEGSGFIKALVLEKNKEYHGSKPYLDKVIFAFFQDEKELQKTINMRGVNGAALQSQKSSSMLKNYSVALPRYFALFFNLKKEDALQEIKMRQAISLAINKQKIISEVFGGNAKVAVSAILPGFFNLKDLPEELKIAFDKNKSAQLLDELDLVVNPSTQKREKQKPTQAEFAFTKTLTLKSQGKEVEELQKCLAKFPDIYPAGAVSGLFGEQTKQAVIKFQEKYPEEILKPNDLTKGTGDVKASTRDKLNEVCFEKSGATLPFEITLTTSDKFPLPQLAQSIKEDLEAVGLSVKIETVSIASLQTDILAKRNFDILLFGEALGSIPDPFPFWHSSQITYPGLNVAGYSSKQADKLLEQAREAPTEEQRVVSLEKFQEILAQDLPAFFLVMPDYVFSLSSLVKGFEIKKITEPSKRFSTIEKWFVETKRVWK